MSRGAVLAAMRVAGFHGARDEFVRLSHAHRVSRLAALFAWRDGVLARLHGVPCGGCERCQPHRSVAQHSAVASGDPIAAG